MRSPLLYLGVAVVLVLFAALIAPVFIDWSNYRAELERYGSKLVGREVKIDGPVRIQILPTPVMSVADVRIANSEGATADSFVTARKIELRLALTPLLKGRIEVQSLQFEGAVFEIEHMPEAGGNWRMRPKVEWADFLSPESIGVASASITDSVIVLRDRGRRGVAFLDDVDLEVSAVSLAGPYRVRGTVTHEDKLLYVSVQTGRSSASGAMRLSVSLEPDGGYVPIYGFDGKFTGSESDARLEGVLRIRRDLPPQFEDAPPLDTAEVGLPYSFKSNVSAGFSEIALTDMELLIDQAQPGSIIAGDVTVALGDSIGLNVDLHTRHIDFDRISERSGLTRRDVAPGLKLVDSIARLVDGAPDDLDAEFRLSANAITVGGETVEAVEFTGKVEGTALTISRIGAVLPGGSELELADLTFAVRAGVPGFEGDIVFSSRDTRGFLAWAMPGSKDLLAAAPRSFKGQSSITGGIALDNRSVGIRHARASVDGSTAEGALVVVPGDRPQILSNLALKDVDFDRYFPVTPLTSTPRTGGAPEQAMLADPLEILFEKFDPALFSMFDGRFAVTVDDFRRWGIQGENLSASVDVAEDGFNLQLVEIRKFNGTDFTLTGDIKWTDGKPRGRLTTRIDSQNLLDVLEIPSVRRIMAFGSGSISDVLDDTGPARLKIDLVSADLGGTQGTAATVEGDFGSTSVQFDATYRGDWNHLRDGRIELDGQLTGGDVDALSRLFDLDLVSMSDGQATDTGVKFSLAGVLSEGMDASLTLDLLDTRFDLKGLVTDGDGGLEIESEVTAKSGDASRLLRALRLGPDAQDGAPVPIDLKGLISGTDDEIIITGVGGKVAGVPVGLDGTVDLAGDRPGLFGNLTVAKLDLPWMVSRVFSLPFNAVASGDRLGIPPPSSWSAEPFRFQLLNTVDLNLVLRVGEVTLLGGSTGTGMHAEVIVAGGVVTVERLESEFAEGELRVGGKLQSEHGQLSMQIEFELERAEFSATLASDDRRAPLRGRYTLSGRLNATGRSPIGFVSSLSGDGSLTIDDGALSGVNPGSFSEALHEVNTAQELEAIIDSVLADGEMVFSGLATNFEVANGLARFDEAMIDGPAAEGGVRAMIDLPAWKLDSEWTIGLKTYPSAPPLKVVLAGPVSEPVRSYDTQALRSFFAVKGLTEGVRQLEQLQREEQQRIERLEELERISRLREARRAVERLRKADREAVRELETQRLREAERRPADQERAAPETPDGSENTDPGPGAGNAPDTFEPGSSPVLGGARVGEPDAVTSPAVTSASPDGEATDVEAGSPQPRPKPRPLPEPADARSDPDGERTLRRPETLAPLDAEDTPSNSDADAGTIAQQPLAPRGQNGPVDITPERREPAPQQNLFSDDPASWRK